MKTTSLLFFELAAATLTATAYAYGTPELAAASVLLGALSLLSLAFFRPAFVHAMLGLYAVVAGLFGLLHMPPLLCAGAVGAVVAGWDAGLIAPQLSRASAENRRHFALGYALRALVGICLGILLVAAAGAIQLSLTFGSGLGLSFAVLVLAALFLRSLRGIEASDDGERLERKEEERREDLPPPPAR
jgi:membrane protein implicated in regulation of membrane protease activity